MDRFAALVIRYQADIALLYEGLHVGAVPGGLRVRVGGRAPGAVLVRCYLLPQLCPGRAAAACHPALARPRRHRLHRPLLHRSQCAAQVGYLEGRAVNEI